MVFFSIEGFVANFDVDQSMSILEHSSCGAAWPGLGTGDGGSKDRDRNTGWDLWPDTRYC